MEPHIDIALTDDSAAPTDSAPWPAPVPLTVIEAPAVVPSDALPDWVQYMVDGVAEAYQVPTELPLLLALSVASVATSGRVFVTPRQDWAEPCSLYTVVALEPGSAKSPVFNRLTRPINTLERELRDASVERVARLSAERAALAKTVARHRDLAGRTDDPEQRQTSIEAAATAEVELAALPLAVIPRLQTSDATPEEIQRLLSIHGGRFAVLHDEGGVFDILAGRYSANTNLDPWLAGHNGGRLSSDRKGAEGSGEHTEVANAYLTMGFAVQPEVLHALGQSGRLAGRGVPARFLFAVPPSRLGRRDLVRATPVPPSVSDRYYREMGALLRHLVNDDGERRIELGLTEAALRAWSEFLTRNERAVGPKGPLRELKGWAGKLPGQVLRLAGILHVLQHPDGGWAPEIPEQTMQDACRIGIALIDHARIAHDLLGVCDELADARAVLDWIQDNRVPAFTKRDTYRALRRLKTAKRAGMALDVLCQYGWIRERDPEPSAHGRRREAYDVHPSISKAAVDLT